MFGISFELSIVIIETNGVESAMPQEILSADGTKVPYTVYGSSEAKANVILLPAMGVRASFYRTLANSLMDFDLTSYVMEYRGLGDSSLRAGWRTDFGYKQHQEDVAALIARVKQDCPGRPIYIAGHSMGGHFAVMTAGLDPDSFDGIIMLASGTPWYKIYEGNTASKIKMLLRLMPLLLLLGYFPGKKIGFAGREARSLMRDWQNLAQDNHFKVKGITNTLEQKIAAYSGEVLCLCFERDDLATRKASTTLLDKMPQAQVTHHILSDEDINGEATHFGWAKTPHRVSQCIREWVG